MSRMNMQQLKAGTIFGDHRTQEYVYLPAGEVATTDPVCVYESPSGRHDIGLEDAVRLIERRALRPVKHPMWGTSSY